MQVLWRATLEARSGDQSRRNEARAIVVARRADSCVMKHSLFDPRDLFIGHTPLMFLLEVVVRILFLYAVLLIAMRFMGRRMSSQLTRNELLALVSLAAAIGPALQDPTRGLLPPLVIAIFVVALQRITSRSTFHSRRFDQLVNGNAEVLLADGRLQIDAMRRNGISRERLDSEIRASGVLQLGAVERVYIETNGGFSLVLAQRAKPGLSIVPAWDPGLAEELQYDDSVRACATCGGTRSAQDDSCQFCHAEEWRPAVRPD
jgi:uncharacterized membrane protein YcaP (DUF421 family)